MIKIPNISAKHLLEVKRKHEMGVTFAKLKRYYNINYNDIKKILRIFDGCNFESEIEVVILDIRERNRLGQIRDHRANYQKYKDYYLQYSKRKYAEEHGLAV